MSKTTNELTLPCETNGYFYLYFTAGRDILCQQKLLLICRGVESRISSTSSEVAESTQNFYLIGLLPTESQEGNACLGVASFQKSEDVVIQSCSTLCCESAWGSRVYNLMLIFLLVIMGCIKLPYRQWSLAYG